MWTPYPRRAEPSGYPKWPRIIIASVLTLALVISPSCLPWIPPGGLLTLLGMGIAGALAVQSGFNDPNHKFNAFLIGCCIAVSLPFLTLMISLLVSG